MQRRARAVLARSSPWSPPLAPPAPQRIAPPCSSASRLLWRSQTSHGRTSSASVPRLPDAGQSRTRYQRCWSAVGPPGSRTRSFCTCRGLRPRRVVQALAIGAPVRMAFHIRNCVGTRDDRSFAVQWLACALPCRRFAGALADVCARLRPAPPKRLKSRLLPDDAGGRGGFLRFFSELALKEHGN